MQQQEHRRGGWRLACTHPKKRPIKNAPVKSFSLFADSQADRSLDL
jgi:hypothetical protein